MKRFVIYLSLALISSTNAMAMSASQLVDGQIQAAPILKIQSGQECRDLIKMLGGIKSTIGSVRQQLENPEFQNDPRLKADFKYYNHEKNKVEAALYARGC